MNLVWKGKFKDKEQLLLDPALPEHAVKFNEPDSLGKFVFRASIFVVPVLFVALIATVIKTLMYGDLVIASGAGHNVVVLALAILSIVPHELMHAACFPRGATVEVWYPIKSMAAFVYCTAPVSKARFVFLGLLPNIVLGFVPLVIWIFVPPQFAGFNRVMFSLAFFNMLAGIGDYLNVYNALRQVPEGGVVHNSGFHSYWYVDGISSPQ